jgi:hypothetical protein
MCNYAIIKGVNQAGLVGSGQIGYRVVLGFGLGWVGLVIGSSSVGSF